jgi:hypothetical protein
VNSSPTPHRTSSDSPPRCVSRSLQVALAELALRFSLSLELLTAALTARLGSHLSALVDGGLLYTPAFLSRLTAQLRGTPS